MLNRYKFIATKIHINKLKISWQKAHARKLMERIVTGFIIFEEEKKIN